MIVSKILLSTGFAGLINYVMGQEKQIKPEQFQTINLFDVSRAAAEMELVADRNPRAKDPVCHIIVSWSREENVDFPRQLLAGRKILSALGLSRHQALIAVHDEPKDGVVPGANGRHHEMHIIVNRVHPDGSINRLPHSYPRAEVAAKRISQQLGFAVVPGRFNGAILDKPGLGEKIGSIQGETGRPTIADELLANPVVMERLRDARRKGWSELLSTFAECGLIVKPPPANTAASRGRAKRGLQRGLVMIDVAEPDRRIKLSALDSPFEKWGATALERELGPVPYTALAAFEEQSRARSADRRKTTAVAPELDPSTHGARYRAFMIEKAKASKDCKEQIDAGKRRRSRIYLEAKVEREAVLARAGRRRKLVRLVCGRGSLVGAALNAILDTQMDAKLAQIRAERDKAVAVLNAETVRDRIPIPRWADWKRRPVGDAARASANDAAVVLVEAPASATVVENESFTPKIDQASPPLAPAQPARPRVSSDREIAERASTHTREYGIDPTSLRSASHEEAAPVPAENKAIPQQSPFRARQVKLPNGLGRGLNQDRIVPQEVSHTEPNRSASHSAISPRSRPPSMTTRQANTASRARKGKDHDPER